MAVLWCGVGVRDDGAWGGGECTRGLQRHYPRLRTGQAHKHTLALLPYISLYLYPYVYAVYPCARYVVRVFRVAGSVDSRVRADAYVCGRVVWQTGTGKTYTMEGFNREGNVEDR